MAAALAAGCAGPSERDAVYWLAPERTPGRFLCRAPAATDVTVVCDRWPDGSDVRRFGLDAIRLSGARTDHEKALAVYRWIRRWMIFPDKKLGSPTERVASHRRKRGYVDQALKLLNVYGIHWCDGQVRVMEAVWRALGYRAEKIVRGGHTVAGVWYEDHDGAARWHLMDVSHSAFALDRTRHRLLTPDELSTRWYSFYYQWCVCPHNGWDDHRVDLALRLGEKLERIWGNWGRPYHDCAVKEGRMRTTVPQEERGPYRFTYGNGRWTYAPDVRTDVWRDGLAARPVNLAPDALRPAAAGKTASAIWRVRTPYIVSDADVRMTLFRKSPDDTVRLLLSVDDGRTWRPVWECPPEQTGRRQVTAGICPRFKVTNRTDPPEGFHSAFGRYSYRLKLELLAKDRPEDCRVDAITFRTTVQQNMMALPQLQPGRNRITVRGALAEGAALRVTYVWDDPLGTRRKNVTVVEQTPWTYEILAAGKRWEDCVCKSLVVEAVPATGEGNRTIFKERPAAIHELPPMRPVAQTVGRWKRPRKEAVPPVAEIIEALNAGRDLRRMVDCAIQLGDPTAFDAVKRVVYECRDRNVKNQAIVALYNLDADRARPVLLDVLGDKDLTRVRWNEKHKYVGHQAWRESAAVIGAIAAEAGWTEFLPGLLKALPGSKPGWGARYGLIRAVGRLGAGSRAAAEAIRDVLAASREKEHGDAKAVAAAVAGGIGDPLLIPALRKNLKSSYEPLKHGAALSLGRLGDRSIAPKMRKWLGVTRDENYRGVAAEALGHLRDHDSVPALRAALAVETFPWIRAKIREALENIDED
jgi:HEAT repeat protein